MPHKKKLFNKGNSVKFLLLHGNNQAVNADGKTLENVLVPVSKNYKAGTSLLMSNVAALCDVESNEDEETGEPDLKKIIDAFDDSDSEEVSDNLPSKMRSLNFSEKPKSESCHIQEVVEDLFDGDFKVEGQFSDASDDSFESDFEEEEEDDDDDIAIDSNCPESLKIFNKKFENVLKEYDDDQIGPLDDEDICGFLSTSSKRVTHMLDDVEHIEEEELVLGHCNEDMKQKILNYADYNGDEKIVEIVTEKPIEFDCESILSTYSNKYNHPTVIREEKVKKIQIPDNPLKKRLTKSKLKELEQEKESDSESDDNVSVATTSFNVRLKGETPEQKRERKNLFKEAKRESRMMKKENKLAFKKEKKLQQAQSINAQRNAGIRLL